jgi:thioredoxin reductase
MFDWDVVIIGGGPAGLTAVGDGAIAAITAQRLLQEEG